jgi:hypothetical protein
MGAAGRGMNCSVLALLEERTVHIDPVLNKHRAMGLDREFDLCIVGRSRGNRKD